MWEEGAVVTELREEEASMIQQTSKLPVTGSLILTDEADVRSRSSGPPSVKTA